MSKQIRKDIFLKKEFLIINPKGLIELENPHFANAYEIVDPSNSSSTDTKNVRREVDEECINLKDFTNRS